MRAYVRHRATWLAYRAAPIQHRDKALQPMHVPLPQGLTDITGVTGRGIIRAMVTGERDAVRLARFRAPRCASRMEEIATALTGHDHPEHVWALTQALALYDASTEPGRAGDAAIARRFQAIKPVRPDALPPLHRRDTHTTHNKNAPVYAASGRRSQLAGRELGAIPGLQARTVPTSLSDIGRDMRQWPNVTAFCSWLG